MSLFKRRSSKCAQLSKTLLPAPPHLYFPPMLVCQRGGGSCRRASPTPELQLRTGAQARPSLLWSASDHMSEGFIVRPKAHSLMYILWHSVSRGVFWICKHQWHCVDQRGAGVAPSSCEEVNDLTTDLCAFYSINALNKVKETNCLINVANQELRDLLLSFLDCITWSSSVDSIPVLTALSLAFSKINNENENIFYLISHCGFKHP